MEAEGWAHRDDKVTMCLKLPQSSDALGKALGSKRRSQIKRSRREDPDVRFGGAELVADFYDVFSRKMRELGTPVYPRRFFEKVVEHLSEYVTLLVVYVDGKPAAVACLIRWRNTLEIPWAAADSAYNGIAVNMLLYWEALTHAIDTGSEFFDFGRSSRDSGTFKFKQQWGAEPIDVPWRVWSRRGVSAAASATGRGMEIASRVWRRLPLPVANWLGPKITSNLPW
jgi:FemAB-related protein (PEP-CTERM system-associated)